jgi:hypothetical protein
MSSINDDPYYGIQKVSNSLLGLVACHRDGLPPFKVSEDTLEFGRQFHEAILEPEKYRSRITEPGYIKNIFRIKEMVKVARENVIIKMALNAAGTRYEFSHFFTEERYDIECKAKFDILSQGGKTIIDLKTTSETTLQGFVESITKYNYHRQAAFYMDHSTADKFVFIGVTKKSPYRTFTVVLEINDELTCIGRKQYEELIDFYILMPDKKLLYG